MRRNLYRLCFGLLAVLLVAFTVAPSAHAASKSPLGNRPAGPQPAVPLPKPSAGLLDQDIIISTTPYPFVTTGRLALTQVSSSTTEYKGTFTDNLNAGKKYAAFGTVDNTGAFTTTTINTHAGKFVFDAAGKATTAPIKLGTGGEIGFTSNHAYTAFTYTFDLTPNLGVSTAITGTITLTKDANGALVNNSKADNVVSALKIGKKITPITTGGVFEPTNTITALLTVLKVAGKTYVLNGTPDPVTKGGISGNAIPVTTKPQVYAFFLLTPVTT